MHLLLCITNGAVKHGEILFSPVSWSQSWTDLFTPKTLQLDTPNNFQDKWVAAT